jgi:hypothetical protein
MIDETGAALKVIQVQEYSDERLIGRYLCLPGPGTFIRKSSAVAINGRQEKWRFVGDYDFWLRISRLGTLQKRDGVLAQWRLHEESTSIAKRGIPMMEEQVLVIEEFISRNVLSKRMIRMSRAHAKYFASITAFQFNYMLGVKTLIKAFVIGKFLSHDFNFRTIAYLLFDPLRIRVSKSLKKLSIYNKWETL